MQLLKQNSLAISVSELANLGFWCRLFWLDACSRRRITDPSMFPFAIINFISISSWASLQVKALSWRVALKRVNTTVMLQMWRRCIISPWLLPRIFIKEMVEYLFLLPSILKICSLLSSVMLESRWIQLICSFWNNSCSLVLGSLHELWRSAMLPFEQFNIRIHW